MDVYASLKQRMLAHPALRVKWEVRFTVACIGLGRVLPAMLNSCSAGLERSIQNVDLSVRKQMSGIPSRRQLITKVNNSSSSCKRPVYAVCVSACQVEPSLVGRMLDAAHALPNDEAR